MKIDLHCHSHFSDGKHEPEYLLQRARANNISHLAITDHDCIEAFNHISSMNEGCVVLPGVEISCFWENQEIHIIGLMIELSNSPLQDLLRKQQALRKQRVEAMDEKLEKLGTPGLKSWVEQTPCLSMSRSHVADFLVEKNICKSRQKAFKNYLGKRGKIYVPASWCSVQQAVQSITCAKGIAILAHPGRYPLSKRKLHALTEEFSSCGGEAIETSYSNIDPNTRRKLAELCQEFNLYASAGSDFHDAAAHWSDIGKYPEMDLLSKKNAIWLHPKWQS